MKRVPRLVPFLLLLASALVLAAAARAGGDPAALPDWLEVDYGALVDREALTPSGEPLGVVLDRLGGRPLPGAGEPGRERDRLDHVLVDPFLERYAFVLPDALDALAGAPDPPMVEIGRLWAPGEPQPAWVALLRARRWVVESDGRGRLRVFLPFREGERTDRIPPAASGAAAERAFRDAWPVLRHVLGAERRRLAAQRGGDAPALLVEVHPYVARPAKTSFLLGTARRVIEVTDTGPDGTRPPLDLEALRAFFREGWQVEGGRLDGDGGLVLLGSRPAVPPTLLGEPVSLADLAVAWRAVAHGEGATPSMSLDRGRHPWESMVDFGGRLGDTRLGWVSLLCDVRFKTFSLGIDVLAGKDVRGKIRESVPGFATHLERFARDPASRQVMGQQTRLWFYPDTVDLVLSPARDLLAIRRARMLASSEGLRGTEAGAGTRELPPWTRETIAAINERYDELAGLFPELRELDQVARLLSLATWLRRARDAGLAIPELDALLALPLPAAPTPRTFPQLLAFDVLPAPGGKGPVDVIDRTDVALALGRLEPRAGGRLPREERFRRAMLGLDPRLPDHRRLLGEMRAIDPRSADPGVVDRLVTRAERLRMHHLVLASIQGEPRERVRRRYLAEPHLRVFSIGIGGLDLGMDGALDRAAGSAREDTLRPGGRSGAAMPAPGGARRILRRRTAGARDAWRRDPAGLPQAVLPDHGAGVDRLPALDAAAGVRLERAFGDHLVRVVDRPAGPGGRLAVRVVETLFHRHGPGASFRRVLLRPGGTAVHVRRYEGGRFLAYSFRRQGDRAQANPGPPDRFWTPGDEPGPGLEQDAPGDLPDDVLVLRVGRSGRGEPGTGPVELVLRKGPERLAAPVPRKVLQRFVLGPRADEQRAAKVPGLVPLPDRVKGAGVLLVPLDPAHRALPWRFRLAPVPGEEDPRNLVRAANEWRTVEAGRGLSPAALAVDVAAAIRRRAAAPGPAKGILLLLPEGAFPGLAARVESALREAWPAVMEGRRGHRRRGRRRKKTAAPPGPVPVTVARELPGRVPGTVVVVSGEDPDVLSARLASLGRDPRLAGRLLAAWPLAGPLRDDLPVRLLEEGEVVGVGLADPPWPNLYRVPERLAEWAGALAGRETIDGAPGPFTWTW